MTKAPATKFDTADNFTVANLSPLTVDVAPAGRVLKSYVFKGSKLKTKLKFYPSFLMREAVD
jgi:hypothetical protein